MKIFRIGDKVTFAEEDGTQSKGVVTAKHVDVKPEHLKSQTRYKVTWEDGAQDVYFEDDMQEFLNDAG